MVESIEAPAIGGGAVRPGAMFSLGAEDLLGTRSESWVFCWRSSAAPAGREQGSGSNTSIGGKRLGHLAE